MAKLKVLIAEDDVTSRSMLQAVICRWGFEAVAVTDGVQAWEQLQKPEGPRLALLRWTLFVRWLVVAWLVAEVFVARAVPELAGDVFLITDTLRSARVAAEMDHQARSLKSQFKQADRLSARYVVVAGPDELAEGEIVLRDMHTKEQTRVAVPDVPARLATLLA